MAHFFLPLVSIVIRWECLVLTGNILDVEWTYPRTCFWNQHSLNIGLHGLKTEARTRPVPEIVWPDPSGTVKFRARTRPEIPPPTHTHTHTTNSQQKKKEKGCISRLHAKKRINQGSAISQTFTSYESLWTSGAAVAYILPSLWILYGQEDDDRANYGHFLSVKAR